MDKDFSIVGAQYIICECGDNFPNENFLSIHLANGHGDVDTFLCDACPEAFTSNELLLQHKLTHKTEMPKKPELKTPRTYKGPLAEIPEKKEMEKKVLEKKVMEHKGIEKKPPVIKVQTLKKINSISLIQRLNSYGRFIKIEPEPAEPSETVPAEVERAEVPVLVKTEMEDAETEDTEEIYYQCDVCNEIFYTEMDFNVHYQSVHALKQEPQTQTAEQILEQHLVMDHSDSVVMEHSDSVVMEHSDSVVMDHSDSVDVQAGVETVYYYECEVGKGKSNKSQRPEAATKENITDTDDTDQPTIKIDTNKSLASTDDQDDTERLIDHLNDQHETERHLGNLNTHEVKLEEDTEKDSNPTNNLGLTDDTKSEYVTDADVMTELPLPDKHDLLKVTHVKETTRRGRRKKKKVGRPPKEDVFANLPPGLTPSQSRKLAEERKKEIRKQQLKKAAEKYRMKNREAIRIANAEYNKRNPETHRKAVAKYAKAHPEVNRKASAKYAKAHPEVRRKAVAKYAKAHPEVNRKASAKYAKSHPEVNRRAVKKRKEKMKQELEINQEVWIKEEVEIEFESILGF